MSHEGVAVVFDLLSELDFAFTKSPHRLVDIGAVKRNIRSARSRINTVGSVPAYIGFGCIKTRKWYTESPDGVRVCLRPDARDDIVIRAKALLRKLLCAFRHMNVARECR